MKRKLDRRGQINPSQTNVLNLFHKREEQIRREMEKQERERRKEEEKMLREKQRQQERFQREEKRESERREKFLQKESLKVRLINKCCKSSVLLLTFAQNI